jgi:hypothetical protein
MSINIPREAREAAEKAYDREGGSLRVNRTAFKSRSPRQIMADPSKACVVNHE